MSSNSQSPNLGESATRFLVSLPPEKREASQQEVYKFVRWYGWERPFAELRAPDIANYAERLSLSDTDYAKKLKLIRTFLIYAKKEGWSKSNLAIHLKTKKAKTSSRSSYHRDLPGAVSLTQQGYAEMETELATLRDKRIKAIDEVRRAAADKDFRENAPLEAAREQRGQIEGQIRELEEALKSATIIDKEGKERGVTLTSSVGDRITLRDLASDKELSFRLVSPNEVDPTKGKISIASPIGKAVIGRSQGEIVGVTTPAGKLRYEIEQIEH